MKSCPLASHFCICGVTRSRHIWHKIIRMNFFSYLIKIGVVWGVLSGVGGPTGLSTGVTRRLALGENRHGEVKSFLGHHTRHHELAAFHLFFLLFTDRLGDWTECPSFLQSPNSTKELTQDREVEQLCAEVIAWRNFSWKKKYVLICMCFVSAGSGTLTHFCPSNIELNIEQSVALSCWIIWLYLSANIS